MTETFKIEGCSMGCLYAYGPIDKCLCVCAGEKHGIMSGVLIPAARCSPAAETRCKDGTEGGACTCACKGVNHAIYKGIADYKITTFSA